MEVRFQAEEMKMMKTVREIFVPGNRCVLRESDLEQPDKDREEDGGIYCLEAELMPAQQESGCEVSGRGDENDEDSAGDICDDSGYADNRGGGFLLSDTQPCGGSC